MAWTLERRSRLARETMPRLLRAVIAFALVATVMLGAYAYDESQY